MPQMGHKYAEKSPSPSPKRGKASAVKGDGDVYTNFSQLNQNIMEEGEDAGGAIMKKLYRIHSRYVLETNENL